MGWRRSSIRSKTGIGCAESRKRRFQRQRLRVRPRHRRTAMPATPRSDAAERTPTRGLPGAPVPICRRANPSGKDRRWTVRPAAASRMADSFRRSLHRFGDHRTRSSGRFSAGGVPPAEIRKRGVCAPLLAAWTPATRNFRLSSAVRIRSPLRSAFGLNDTAN